MTPPLEAQPKPEARIAEEPPELDDDHVANEAVGGLESVKKATPANDTSLRSLPSEQALLGLLRESAQTEPVQNETLKRDNGYAVTVGKDASGNIVRIAETDGTEWSRSPDGKFFVLNQTGEKVPVKDVKVEKDGTYTIVMPDGQQLRRNADRSVSTLDASGNERKRLNNDGTQLLFDDKHRVIASVDAAGARRGYGYANDGKLASIVDPDGSVWRSNDGKNWRNEKTRQSRSGEIAVAEDGSQTVKNGRGETNTFKIDGSQISRDAAGNVVAIKNLAGEERRFSYTDGKLSAIKEPDGTAWSSKDGKTWTQDGTRNSARVDISVDADGSVREKYPAGKEVVKRTDGWSEIKDGNATRFEKKNADGSSVTKNSLDQVTQITDARGRTRKFEYDEQGRINKMTDSTGTWSSSDGKNWTNDKSKETWKGRLENSQEGLYREVQEDGSRKVFKTDGSKISVDSNNRITRVEASNGTWRQFDYGKDGKIAKVSESGGAKWSTTDGTNWTKEGSNETRKMNVSVRPDGTYQETDLSNGNRRVGTTDGRNLTFDKNSVIQRAENTDGSSTRFDYGDRGEIKGFAVKNKDGSQVTLDPQGRVIRTQTQDNQVREFKYGTNGKLSEIKEADGKVWTSKDGENWQSNKGDKSKGAVWVTPDGNYNYVENNAVVTKRLDGNTQYRDSSGASRTENKAGQVVETVDSKGVKRTYGYGADGNVNRMTEGDAVWETKDGRNWTNTKDGAQWQGTVKVEKDGSYFHEDAAGNRQWRKMDGSRQDVNYQAMDAAAEALETAMNRGFMWGAGTDKDTIYATLENKTEAERKMIKEIWDRKYKDKYGWDLEKELEDEMKGSDLEKAKSLLTRPDGADNAGTIRQALVERGETFGRSNTELEKIVRNSLETMSSAEIVKTDAEYRRRYGVSLNDAIQNDPNLSKETKAAAAVYIKGHDQRTPEDTKKLAVDAANAGNAEMFQEAMRRAPKEVRDYFAGPEGQKLIKDNFEGHWYHAFTFGLSGNVTDTQLNHVQDYAEYGKLSVATQVSDNRSWLGDNEDAIEQSLANMSKEERDRYALGKRIANNETPETPVSEADRKKALDYYTKTHEQLKAAAGKWFSGDSQVNELAKWEDMITQKGGSLVTQLANHRGNIYDSSMQDVISTVENMSKDDWERLKNDPAQIGKIEQVLKTYLSQEEFDRTMKVITDKRNAASYEASQQQRRPILDAIEDNKRWYNNDEAAIYRTLESMTDNERAQYKRGSEPNASAEDKKFKDDLDAKLKGALDASEQQVAFGLLDQVKRGEKPVMGILDKLNLQASYVDADEAQVIRDIQSAFDKDPKMRERITNPQTPEDKAFSDQFRDAARRAMGSSDYEKYAKPLIETGKLSIELQMELNNGVFDDDEQGAYRDIQRASAAEKQRILTDKRFQERVMGFLSEDERKVALASMEQGEMRPEDKLRSYQLGLGTSEAEIKETLAALNDRTQLKAEGKSEAEIDQIIQGRIQRVRDEYARKYGGDLSADLVSELGGKDQRQALRQVNGRDARSEFLYAMQEAATTRSGFGSRFVDNAWDGTGYQLDNEVNQLAAKMVEDPAKMREYVDNLYKMVDMHASSKEALADAVVDTTIAAVAVGGSFFTGGVSLSLLAYTGAAAAVFKVGAKGAIMGGDYDWGSSQVVLDGATGFADGFTTFLGAGVAKSAAEKMIVLGGRQMLKEGAEVALKKGAQAIVKEGLAKGGKISQEAIEALSKQIAREGEEQAVAALLRRSVTEAVEEQSRTVLKQLVMSAPANTLAGMAGGGLSGTIRAGAEARDFQEFLKMAGTATTFGALGGGVGPFVLVPGAMVAGKSWNAVRSAVSREASQLDNVAAAANRSVHQQPVDEPTFSRAVGRREVVEEPVIPSEPRFANDNKPAVVRTDGEAPVVRTESDPPLRTEGEQPGPGRDGGDTPPVKEKPPVRENADTPENLRDVVEEPQIKVRDSVPGREPDLQQIKDISAELARRQNEAPIIGDKFKQILDKVPKEDRKLAMHIIEASTPNAHRRVLDHQMENLVKALRERAPNAERITVVAMSEDEASKALGYLLRTNADLTNGVDIRVLDQSTMKAGLPASTGPILVFEDLARATAEQAAFLKKLPEFYATDLGGFESGVNLWDLSLANKVPQSMEALQEKIAALTAEAKKLDLEPFRAQARAADAKLTPEQVEREAMSLAVKHVMQKPLNDAAAQFGNARVIRPSDVEVSGRGPRLKKGNVDEALALYHSDVLRRPMMAVNKKDGNLALADVQAKDVESWLKNYKLNGEKTPITPAQQEAVAVMLRDGMLNNNYDVLMNRLQKLPDKIKTSLPPGKTMDDVVILTGVENNGSANLVQHLYGRVSGARKDQFVSLGDFAANPKAFKDKVVVYMDDYVYSGQQLVNHLDSPLPTAPGAKGLVLGDLIKDSGAELMVVQLAGYKHLDELAIKNRPYALVYAEDNLLPQFYDSPALKALGFSEAELRVLGGSAKWTDNSGGKEVGAINPYRSQPTNNPRVVREFNFNVLKDRANNSYRQAERGAIAPRSEVSGNLWRGGAPANDKEFARMVEETGADIVIDLRGINNDKELQSIVRQRSWADKLPDDKRPQMLNIKIPTEYPAVGSAAYGQMLDSLHQVQSVIAKAEAEGKKVFIHCYHGKDRTGLVNALHDVLSRGKSVDEALANWERIGDKTRENFHHLYQRNMFEQILADYRAKYGN